MTGFIIFSLFLLCIAIGLVAILVGEYREMKRRLSQ